MSIIKKMLREFMTPSPDIQNPHHRAATGVWHSAIGAVPALIMADYGTWPALTTVSVILAAYAAKEVRDIRRGGLIADSIEDTAFVTVGALAAYFDALIGIAIVNVMALTVMAIEIRKQK